MLGGFTGMARFGPLGWGTTYFGIFAITAALVLNAAMTGLTAAPSGDEVGFFFELAAWLAVAAVISLLLGLLGTVVQQGWRFWQGEAAQDPPG